jgi:hypothetical protein
MNNIFIEQNSIKFTQDGVVDLIVNKGNVRYMYNNDIIRFHLIGEIDKEFQYYLNETSVNNIQLTVNNIETLLASMFVDTDIIPEKLFTQVTGVANTTNNLPTSPNLFDSYLVANTFNGTNNTITKYTWNGTTWDTVNIYFTEDMWAETPNGDYILNTSVNPIVWNDFLVHGLQDVPNNYKYLRTKGAWVKTNPVEVDTTQTVTGTKTFTQPVYGTTDETNNNSLVTLGILKAYTETGGGGRLTAVFYGYTGKTSGFTIPNPTNVAENYFDFTTNTEYKAKTDLSGWDVVQAYTDISDSAYVRVTGQFWDLGVDSGRNGIASYVKSDNSWDYQPEIYNTLGSEFQQDSSFVWNLAPKAVTDAKMADKNTGNIVEDTTKYVANTTYGFGAFWQSIINKINGLFAQVSTAISGLATKQDKLVSGTNIKSVAGQTLLGTGDVDTLYTGLYMPRITYQGIQLSTWYRICKLESSNQSIELTLGSNYGQTITIDCSRDNPASLVDDINVFQSNIIDAIRLVRLSTETSGYWIDVHTVASSQLITITIDIKFKNSNPTYQVNTTPVIATDDLSINRTIYLSQSILITDLNQLCAFHNVEMHISNTAILNLPEATNGILRVETVNNITNQTFTCLSSNKNYFYTRSYNESTWNSWIKHGNTDLLKTNGSSSINKTTDGTLSVKISSTANNGLSLESDGLYVAESDLKDTPVLMKANPNAFSIVDIIPNTITSPFAVGDKFTISGTPTSTGTAWTLDVEVLTIDDAGNPVDLQWDSNIAYDHNVKNDTLTWEVTIGTGAFSVLAVKTVYATGSDIVEGTLEYTTEHDPVTQASYVNGYVQDVVGKSGMVISSDKSVKNLINVETIPDETLDGEVILLSAEILMTDLMSNPNGFYKGQTVDCVNADGSWAQYIHFVKDVAAGTPAESGTDYAILASGI